MLTLEDEICLRDVVGRLAKWQGVIRRKTEDLCCTTAETSDPQILSVHVYFFLYNLKLFAFYLSYV